MNGMNITDARKSVKYETAFAQLLRKAAPDGPTVSQTQKVGELVEAYRSDTMVIKIGGAALSEKVDALVFDDMKLLNRLGIPMVLVHGGGKAIDRELDRLGIMAEWRSGQRVSDSATISVIADVLPRIGTEITYSFKEAGIDAVQIWGHCGVLKVERISEELGYVGRVTEVNADLISGFAKGGTIPVVTPLGFNDGHVYNINADLASSAIAGAVGAKKIIFITNVDGIFDGKSWRSEITTDEIIALQNSRKISYGMIPKAEAVVSAVRDFKMEASIINGWKENSLLSSLFGFNVPGTEIVA